MQTQFVTHTAAWSDLRTVTTFDAGTTHPVDGMDDENMAVQDIRSISPSSLLVETLIEHLCKLLEKDPVNQKNLYKVICGKLHQMKLIDQTYGLEEFESLRSYYQKALLHLVSVAKSTVNETEVNSIVKLSSPSLDLSSSALKEEQLLHWSRYSTDYVELQFIAKGGFGQVFKVRHKLDGGEYAIKKIFLRYRNLNSFYRNIQEVKLLAKLNHPNIVSYKAAWLEPLFSFTTKHVSPQDSELEDISNIPDVSCHIHKRPVLHDMETEESSSIIFRENESEKRIRASFRDVTVDRHIENLNGLHIRKHVSSEMRQNYDTSTSGTSSQLRTEGIFSTREDFSSQGGVSREEENRVTSLKEKALCRFMIQAPNSNREIDLQHEWAVLYIQMQLCSCTLRDWLNERNANLRNGVVNVKESLRIFNDILLGVEYIHSQGIVHHDIKPSNVFVNGCDASQIQVGDFGLACFLHHSAEDVTLIASHNHRGEFGTKLYAAPEQLEGKCDIKSDIYSLGIVLFELLCPFKTDMERSLVITKLRTGIFPLEMDSQNPELVQLITHLMSPHPHKRPSARDTLQRLETISKSISCENLGVKDDEYCKEYVEKLHEELSRKNQEIEELKKKVQELEVAHRK